MEGVSNNISDFKIEFFYFISYRFSYKFLLSPKGYIYLLFVTTASG